MILEKRPGFNSWFVFIPKLFRGFFSDIPGAVCSSLGGYSPGGCLFRGWKFRAGHESESEEG